MQQRFSVGWGSPPSWAELPYTPEGEIRRQEVWIFLPSSCRAAFGGGWTRIVAAGARMKPGTESRRVTRR